jgi:mercuric ion transport protein
MPTPPLVELVYFPGCPHVEAARTALRGALERSGLAPVWQEWDQTTRAAPARVQGLGSPTILINQRDVTGPSAPTAGRACRADGIPRSEVILAVLAAAGAA